MGGQLDHPRLISPNEFDRNFEIAILFRIDHVSYNNAYGIDTAPQKLGLKGCKLFPRGI